ncbi:small integral membrane protein 12 isoform X1 [Physeter macrocephalus]|uniref:Small integral membrane protein 12 n=1 Tax=Physeter macrocephalus TaxID=9755 RepID=A0A455B2T9_PHYMC|nr:small integral membrane protein 12 isoform X1 [Physeter catodon]|eukprot:XP_028342398.1 small integral membrane protein 12 isoform X1 [Physeter catodon]
MTTVVLHKLFQRPNCCIKQGALLHCSEWGGCSVNCARLPDVMWPVLWTVVRTYAPYVTFPVAFVVGAVGYHLEWFIRGKDPQPVEEEKSISERREDRKLDELLGKDHTQVVSLKDKLEFAPKAVLNRNRPEKN